MPACTPAGRCATSTCPPHWTDECRPAGPPAACGVLPADVRVRGVGPAASGFDARFSASGRRYAYRVSDDPRGPDPLWRGFVVPHRRGLDVEAMGRASAALLGEHDFAAFCRRREGASTVRTLRTFSWQRDPDGLVVADVRADAFCHSMVRALVGALLPVGDGRRPADLAGARCSAAGDAAPRRRRRTAARPGARGGGVPARPGPGRPAAADSSLPRLTCGAPDAAGRRSRTVHPTVLPGDAPGDAPGRRLPTAPFTGRSPGDDPCADHPWGGTAARGARR